MKAFGFVAAFAALAIAAPANAATFIVTYEGTMTSGTDETGHLFGAGTDLTGKSFTAVFTVDDSTPGRTLTTDAFSQTLSGNNAANPVKAVLTLEGAAAVNFGTTRGSSQRIDKVGHDYIASSANNTPRTPGFHTYEDLQLYLNVYDNAVSFFPGTNVSYAVQPAARPDGTPGDFGGGSFALQTYSFGLGQNTRYVHGGFTIENVSISSTVSAVPEPATWAFMIVGFGAIGGTMRAARRQTAVRFAA